ncbi:MAG: tRNA 5-methylaminomethyl-2-thiouridine biosynthesis bifunctional protein [Moritella sp.]
MSHDNITNADVIWDQQGIPVSSYFDDRYFSAESGLAESRYVFLQQNNLFQRWLKHDQPFYVIAETGFGTGRNFLAAWHLFSQFRRAHPEATCQRLHMISFEKFPLSQQDLTKALAAWPHISNYSKALADQYPIATPDCHRLKFADDQIVLDLWFGDIKETLPKLYIPNTGLVDSWFLDGFAPSKNPQMWTDVLFRGMYKLARNNATFSTFTASGFVRRGLISAGWTVIKRKGFGRKKEMLLGHIDSKPEHISITPWFNRTPGVGNKVAIIGGGIASAFSALSLTSRGYQVELYCKDAQFADGASGNKQGAVYPLLNGLDEAQQQFYLSAFLYMRRFTEKFAQQAEFDYGFSGVLQLAYNAEKYKKLQKIYDYKFPAEIVSWHDARSLSELAKVDIPHPGLHFPLGFWACPAQITKELLRLAGLSGRLTTHLNSEVSALNQTETGWQLSMADSAAGSNASADIVIMAAGHHTLKFKQFSDLPLSPVRGQVTNITTHKSYVKLAKVLCYNGYMAPLNGAKTHHCIGASYIRENTTTHFSAQEQNQNKENLVHCLAPEKWPEHVPLEDASDLSRIRCAYRDHLPFVGNAADLRQSKQIYTQFQLSDNQHPAPVFTNLYLNSALGARGVCSAALTSEILASQIAGEPLPVPSSVLQAINPNRVWINTIFKGRPFKA